MRTLYYDCFSGISGDMNLGAMVDAGVDSEYLAKELSKLNISGYELMIKKDTKNGISGTKVDVILTDEHVHTEESGCSHHHNHGEHDHHHEHRNLMDIEHIIEKSSLNQNIKDLSLKIFRKVAEAEAKVHNKRIEEIHFHEVGAVDSIVDIVGAAICFDYLKIERVECSAVEVGSGFVRCAHGLLPVPAPATAELLKGVAIKSNLPFEATTPTGAAILACMVDEYSESKNFSINNIGYGLGGKETKDIPDMLRVFIGEN